MARLPEEPRDPVQKREMRPLYVEELAVHPTYQGRGIGNFMMEQLGHLAKLRGCSRARRSSSRRGP